MEKGEGSFPSAPPSHLQPPEYHGGFVDTDNNAGNSVPPTFGFTFGDALPMPPHPIETRIEPTPAPPPSYVESTLIVDCPNSEEQIKEAILFRFKDRCCFDPKSVDALTISDITQMHAFRYLLDTFIETRTIEEKTEPYQNQYIDGVQHGPVPDKWMVPANPPQLFIEKAKFTLDMPHSASVISCIKCASTGFTACTWCNGLGFKRCTWCNGSGRKQKPGQATEYENCSSCNGMGRDNCNSCQLGRVQCNTCRGHRSLKVWQYLTVKWRTDAKIHVTERGELNPQRLKKAQSEQMLATSETTPQNPQPIQCALDPSISLASQGLIAEQLGKQTQDLRVILFRQRLGVIPVVKATYRHKQEDGHLFVYGNTRLVYFPRGYPGGNSCCCCCSIV